MKLTCEEYFGGCPLCGEASWLNVGKTHWCYCKHHKFRWSPGSNLLSSWRDETEADWRANAERLRNFLEVDPLAEGEIIPLAAEAERSVEALFQRLFGGAA